LCLLLHLAGEPALGASLLQQARALAWALARALAWALARALAPDHCLATVRPVRPQ